MLLLWMPWSGLRRTRCARADPMSQKRDIGHPVSERSLLPGLPRSFPFAPKVFQLLLVAECVHGLPESVVEEGLHLALCNKGLQRFPLKHPGVILDLFKHAGGQNEEAPVDPAAFVFGLFLEGVDVVVLESECSKACQGLNGGERDFLTVSFVELDKGVDVYIRYTVAVGHEEGLVWIQIFADAPYATAGAGVIASVHERDPPRLRCTLRDGHLVFLHIEGDIRGVKEVVCEELLDDVSLVPAADDEVVDAEVGVDFHDVPKNRATTDLYHRFRANGRFLANPCAETAGKKNCLHN